ncbi:MAG: DNA repair protein RecN [Rhodobacteraceae bacterium]|nr:DNA repair protein RecN [Paracoccaceae bacterium]
MLQHLSIRNILLIEQVDLDFGPGLNVLTGETGAGKSILLDSLGFVLGWRGRAGLVRSGAKFGEVIAQFDLSNDHPAIAVLENAGLGFEGDLILRRVNNPDGRKRAFLNDRPVSSDVLRELSQTLVEIHGQHDDRGLLDPKGHKNLLDIFAENQLTLEKTRKTCNTLRQAQNALATAQKQLELAEADKEFMIHALAELETLAPKIGEDSALDVERRRMQSAERIRADIEKGNQLLGSAETMLLDSQRWLEDVSGAAEGGLDAGIDALSRAMIEITEAQHGVNAVLQGLEFSPYDLEQVEERLFAIRAMARKYEVQPDELPGLLIDFNEKLRRIDLDSAHLLQLQKALEIARDAYRIAAGKLSERRQKAAKKLDRAMQKELAPLKMERAQFMTNVVKDDTAKPSPEGDDNVFFTVATNPGAPAGPIDKIASGGELSRFLLALKVCLTTRSDGLTLIFDEIDRGVGGATADAVGRRLAAVAKDTQTLVVTHSPQVAAIGATHFVVSKSVQAGQTTTKVTALDAGQRRDEIARMLAGDTVTDAARAAADALLA